MLKMIQVHLVDNQCCAKQEVGSSSSEVVSVEGYKLAQNSLAFEETQLQHADMLKSKSKISCRYFSAKY